MSYNKLYTGIGMLVLLVIVLILNHFFGEPHNIFYISLGAILTMIAFIVGNLYISNSIKQKNLQKINDEIDELFDKYGITAAISGGAPTGFESLPPELIYAIMEKSDPPTFIALTSTNSRLFLFRDNIAKDMLKKYSVEYENPHDFIYESSNIYDTMEIKILKKEIDEMFKTYNQTRGVVNYDQHDYTDFLADAKNVYYDNIYKKKLNIVSKLTPFEKLKLYNRWYSETNLDISTYSTYSTWSSFESSSCDTFPSYPNLRDLSIGARVYPIVSYLDHGYAFFIRSIFKISRLPNLRALTSLRLTFSDIKEIKNLPSLETLIINYTPIITELKDLPSLKYLYTTGTNIKEVKDLPSLTYVNMHNTHTTEIKDLPSLRFLKCDIGIKKIYNVPLLEGIYFHDFSPDPNNIIHLSNVPKLEWINDAIWLNNIVFDTPRTPRTLKVRDFDRYPMNDLE